MNKKIVLVFVGLALSAAAFLNSCGKDETISDIDEPITIQKPDSLAVRCFPGDSLPIQIEFTTDRPIDWVMGKYDIDSLHPNGYIASFPDTLFLIHVDTIIPRSNKYTYTGLYFVPDTLNAYAVVRFLVTMQADTLHYSKQFKINVR